MSLIAAARRDPAARSPEARRAPDASVWILLRPMRPADPELIAALGGTAYRPDGTDLVTPGNDRVPWTELRELPEITWVELGAGIAPLAVAGELQEAVVVTTGTLARWVIDKYRAAGLDLTVSVAQLRSIFRPQPQDWPAVLIRVAGRGRPLPKAFSRSLADLPQTVVCRVGSDRLLVDHRLVLPVHDEEMARQVPAGQLWMLAGGLGPWMVTERGGEVAPPVRAQRGLLPPAVPAAGRFPPDLATEVALVADDRAQSVDAILLTDDELILLRRLLTGQPGAERAFLVLGPGWHLFADPGRDVSALPLGLPLHKIGPGALYQQAGYRLQPSLPQSARAELFGVTSEDLVILRPAGSLRLSLAATVPVWSLWLDASVTALATAEPLSAFAVGLLGQADAADARFSVPDLAADLPPAGHAGLRSEGFLLEQQGKLAEAARKYWEAGDPALAARLFELAAESDSAEASPA